jgi:hypothetical protein
MGSLRYMVVLGIRVLPLSKAYPHHPLSEYQVTPLFSIQADWSFHLRYMQPKQTTSGIVSMQNLNIFSKLSHRMAIATSRFSWFKNHLRRLHHIKDYQTPHLSSDPTAEESIISFSLCRMT